MIERPLVQERDTDLRDIGEIQRTTRRQSCLSPHTGRASQKTPTSGPEIPSCRRLQTLSALQSTISVPESCLETCDAESKNYPENRQNQQHADYCCRSR